MHTKFNKTVGGVARTRYILPIHFCSIRARKKSKLKMKKNVIKNNFRILKKQYAYLQTILKAPVNFEKDWPKTVGGFAGTRMVGALMDGRMDGHTLKISEGITYYPATSLVAGHKNGPIMLWSCPAIHSSGVKNSNN